MIELRWQQLAEREVNACRSLRLGDYYSRGKSDTENAPWLHRVPLQEVFPASRSNPASPAPKHHQKHKRKRSVRNDLSSSAIETMPPSVNLTKFWAKFGPEFGRTTRHLSPYEVHPVRSLITTMPYKTIRKIKENGLVLIPATVLLVGTVKWGNAANDAEHRTHWS